MSKESNRGGGIGFTSLLTIVFITLKLTGHIDWSWWWVLSPMLIVFGLLALIALIVGVAALIK